MTDTTLVLKQFRANVDRKSGLLPAGQYTVNAGAGDQLIVVPTDTLDCELPRRLHKVVSWGMAALKVITLLVLLLAFARPAHAASYLGPGGTFDSGNSVDWVMDLR
jgi:hypothetical protein